MLLVIRVAALYRGVRWVLRLLWLAFALFQGFRSAILLFGAATLFSELTLKQCTSKLTSLYAESVTHSQISNMCIVGTSNYRLTALVAIPTILDLLLFVLTAAKAIRGPASLRRDSIVRMKYG